MKIQFQSSGFQVSDTPLGMIYILLLASSRHHWSPAAQPTSESHPQSKTAENGCAVMEL